MNKMCLIISAFLLALAMGPAGAYPLQASDGNATVFLFGAIRMPIVTDNIESNDTHEILKIDTGLKGADNATYKIMDQHDAVYNPLSYRPLNPSRQLVYFVVPKDSLFKMITATPEDGSPININWWATPKAWNENLLIRYYGIRDWLIFPDDQWIVVQVRGQNNGTQDVTFSPEDFVLLDQWSWPYSATDGFDAEVIAPGNASQERVLVGFSGISLQSRPVALVYGYYTDSPIVIDFDSSYLQLTNEQVYGTAGAQNVSAAQPAGQAVQPIALAAAATNESAVAGAAANNTTAQNATVASNINSSVSSTKARLAAARERLKQQTKDDAAKGSTTPSSATPSNATPSNATPSNDAASSNNAPSSSPEPTGIFSSAEDIM